MKTLQVTLPDGHIKTRTTDHPYRFAVAVRGGERPGWGLIGWTEKDRLRAEALGRNWIAKSKTGVEEYRVLVVSEAPPKKGKREAEGEKATQQGKAAAAQGDVGISDTVFTLEVLWGVIQTHHPDLPPAVIVVASGEEESSMPKWGHFGATRWKRRGDGTRYGEVMVAGEALDAGAEEVLNTLLHEAAHALAAARGVSDTSRQGRYHNERYKAIAQETGLRVEKTNQGWNDTYLTPEARSRYGDALRLLEEKLRVVRPSRKKKGKKGDEEGEHEGGEGEGEGKEDEKKGGRAVLMCQCQRRIYVAPKVAALGPLVCGLCLREFIPMDQAKAGIYEGGVWQRDDD